MSHCDLDILFLLDTSQMFCFYSDLPGVGLPYETDGDARRKF